MPLANPHPSPRVRLLALYLTLASCAWCNPSEANGTALFVVMNFASGITPDQIRMTVSANGSVIGAPQTFPAPANGPLGAPQSLRILLDDKYAGSEVQVTAEGLQNGGIVGSDGAHPTPVLGQELTINLVLGQVRVACPGIISAVGSSLNGNLGGPTSAWLTYLPPNLICASMEESVAQGRQDFDSSKVSDCSKAMSQLSLADCLEFASHGAIALSCAAFTPRTAVGGACTFDWDCVGGWCDTSAACPGQCRAVIQPGSACDSATDKCAAGATCFDGQCATYARANAPCGGGAHVQCDDSQYYCDPKTNSCLPRQTSGTCTQSTANQCAPKYGCAGQASGSYVCTPWATEGTSCQTQVCETFTICTSQVCILWPSAGSCGDGVVCLGTCCSGMGGTCGACPSAGSPCSGLLDCGPLSFCSGAGICRPIICPASAT
jgi:hypothetical protein